jgi:hypothetical protein
MKISNESMKKLLQESHRRQFAGEDYQYVAISIAENNRISFESNDYIELQSAPDPNCDCGFCATANWQD